MSRGEDPLADFAEAEEDLASGMGAKRDYWYGEFWRRRGMLRTRRGTYRMSRREDPEADFIAAEEDFAQALRVSHLEGTTWNERGFLRIQRGLHLANQGKDPLGEYAEAERILTEALRLNRQIVNAWRNRGHLRTLRGTWRMNRGEDPRVDFAAAEQDLTEALRRASGSRAWLASDRLPPWVYRGKTWTLRGIYRTSRGEDSRAEFAAAEEDFEQALRFNRADAEALAERGRLRSSRAAFREREGDVPQACEDYAAAASDYSEALRINAAVERHIGELLKNAQKRAAELKEP
jgi:tetratricopeptide (TPR) repeat protein